MNRRVVRSRFIHVTEFGRGRVQPSSNLIRPIGHASRTDVRQQQRVEVTGSGDCLMRERIHCAKPLLQSSDGFVVRDVDLGDHNAIGHRRLLDRLRHRVELTDAVDRVDQRHDPVQPVLRAEQAVGPQRVQHGNRIGESCRLDEHAIEVDDLARAPLDEQLPQRLLQIGA